MVTLAHISDIHLAPLPPVRVRDLFGKRITGFLNWKLKRQKTLGGEGLANLMQHLRGQHPDMTVVTGDLVNLALDAEINGAYNWLQSVGGPEQVCISPGNHDAYVRGALERALTRWSGYAEGETLDEAMFPFVRRLGDVAIISCSSAAPSPPWFATGLFSQHQAARLARILQMLGDAGYFRVVLIHHPPNIEAQHPRYGLWGSRHFRAVIAEHGAEMVLHGHTHRSTVLAMPGPTGDIPVIGVAAAGHAQGADDGDDPARYNLFKIERNSTGWSCTLREYGFQRLGTEIVMRMQMRIY